MGVQERLRSEASNSICGTGPGACCAGSNDGCPPEAPVCSEYGYCQCSSYQPGGPACGPGFDDEPPIASVGGQANGGQVCGTGQGACCAGSNDGCPPEAPVCSEYGYCQCSSYQPGGPECGPGFGDNARGQGQVGGGQVDYENPVQQENDKGQVYDNTNQEIDQLYEDEENNNDEMVEYDGTEQITRRSIPGGQEVEGQVCGTGQGACCAGSNEGCPPEAPICSEYGYCQCSSYQPGGPECGPGFGDNAGGQGQVGGG